jgi:DNA-binding NtrC family response regulator
VDDDIQQLDLLDLIMKRSGFSVVTTNRPVDGISLMNEHTIRKIDVAVIDYHVAVMNGCVLAAYLKARYPELRIVLYSAAVDVPEGVMMSLDGFISKGNGIGALLPKITEFGDYRIRANRSGNSHSIRARKRCFY